VAKGKRQKARGKRQEARGKRKEARGKRKEERGKRKEARGKRQKDGYCAVFFVCKFWSVVIKASYSSSLLSSSSLLLHQGVRVESLLLTFTLYPQCIQIYESGSLLSSKSVIMCPL
jgi:hypothetical protein